MALLQGGRTEKPGGIIRVLVVYLSEELSDAAIDELGWKLWELEGVKKVSFRFSGDELPGGGVSKGRALLLWIGEEGVASALESEVSRLAGGKVMEVELLTLRYPVPTRLPPLSRVISLVALVFFAFVSLVLARSAVVRTLSHWRNEWDLLRFSGVEPWLLMGDFIAVALLWGLVGCVLYLAIYQGLKGAVGGIPAVREVAPGYLASRAFPYLTAFIIGPVWAALAGGFALLLTLRPGRRPRVSEIPET